MSIFGEYEDRKLVYLSVSFWDGLLVFRVRIRLRTTTVTVVCRLLPLHL